FAFHNPELVGKGGRWSNFSFTSGVSAHFPKQLLSARPVRHQPHPEEGPKGRLDRADPPWQGNGTAVFAVHRHTCVAATCKVHRSPEGLFRHSSASERERESRLREAAPPQERHHGVGGTGSKQLKPFFAWRRHRAEIPGADIASRRAAILSPADERG